MKLLLIMNKLVNRLGTYYDMPLGLLYISAVLKESNFEVECLNLNQVNESAEDIITKTIIDKKIDVVCTGGISPDYNGVKNILQISKTCCEDIITIAGGGLISSEPELMLENLPMDFGVIGEGELTIVELMQCLMSGGDLNKVNGVIFKDETGKTTKTPARKPIMDLDSLPYPDYDGFGIEEYLSVQCPSDSPLLYPLDSPRYLPIISSRGCCFNCSFCYHPLGRVYRQRSMESLFKEIDYYIKKYKINILYIMDELFAIDQERVNEFCERIRKYNVLWCAQLRADVKLNKDNLRKMKDSGAYIIGFGLENASNTILKSINKKTTIALVEEKYDIAKEVGLTTGGNILFGDPAETPETIEENFKWLEKNIHQYTIFSIGYETPFPGSKIYRQCLESGVIEDKLKYIEGGCRLVNMTELDNRSFENIFHRISRFKSMHRKYCHIIDIEQICYNKSKEAFQYSMIVKCPHCHKDISYKNFHVNEIRIYSPVCRSCGLLFDILPTGFNHINKIVNIFNDSLQEAYGKKIPVSVGPFLQEYNFYDFMKILDIDYDRLDIKYFLDARPRSGMKSKYPIIERTKQNIRKYCNGHLFLVIPWPDSTYPQIVKHLMEECDVDEDRIIYAPFN